MTQVLLIAICATIIWVVVDSYTNKIPSHNKGSYSISNGPISWAFTIALLWPLTFPSYIIKRASTQIDRKSKLSFNDITHLSVGIIIYLAILIPGIIHGYKMYTSVPGCASETIVNTVLKIVNNKYEETYGDDNNVIFSLETIKTQNVDNESRKCACASDLKWKLGTESGTMPITYLIEGIDGAKGEYQITVFGL